MSEDGTITGYAVTTWQDKYRAGAYWVGTLTAHINFFEEGVGLIDRIPVLQHYTFDGNGRLINVWGYF